jgi:acyl-CoA synthetase (NDP forming)
MPATGNAERDVEEALRAHAFRLAGSTDWCVPEPFVKELLTSFGVSVPAGVVVEVGQRASVAAAALREPYVLKAWGPGIVHKSELGAVRVGVRTDTLDEDADTLLVAVAAHGISEARLYVEEMAPPGTEVLFGLVARPPFGTLAILGSGGTSAELFDDVIVRLCPLSRETAEEMVGGFRGAPRLHGHRGAPPADRDALVSALVRLAGEGGLPDLLGASFAEFECNPLFVGADGVVAADARLVVHDRDAAIARPAARPFDATALLAPRSVAVVGASASRSAWGNRTIARYRALGWTDHLYAVHPSGEMIDGTPTYRTLGDIPGGVDYAEISLSAEQCADAFRSARGNVKTATINAAGFSEVGASGKALELELVEAAAEGGVRFVGPNCMGVYSPRGRQGFSGASGGAPGHVGAVLQSGGLATDLIQAGTASGLRFSSVVSAGNAVDVGVGDLVQHLVRDPDTTTIAVHVEGGADTRLVDALREARGATPVVVLLPGLSATGARVAASHTGALTSERRSWEALVEATGLVLTETFEQFLASLVYLDRYRELDVVDDDTVLIMGLGGGASVLAADACDAFGLRVPVLSEELQVRLSDKKGGIPTNPLDLRMGPAGPPSGPREVLDVVLPLHPFPDVLLHVDAMNYANSTVPGRLPGLQHFVELLECLTAADRPHARISVVTRNLSQAPGHFRDEFAEQMLVSGVPMFERFSDAAAAISAAQRFTRRRRARRDQRAD